MKFDPKLDGDDFIGHSQDPYEPISIAEDQILASLSYGDRQPTPPPGPRSPEIAGVPYDQGL